MTHITDAARGSTKNVTDFYIEVKDGHGNMEKQLNFNNEEVCPKTGLIELIPLKERKFQENRVSFRRVFDRETGASIGIPTHIDPKERTWVYKQITLVGRRIFDLSNKNDREEWACIKYSPYLEGSPNQDRNAPPIYKVYDKEKQALENIAKTKVKRRAEHYADKLEGEFLDNMLKACGIGTAGLSEIMKQAAIIQFAESEPETFLKHYDSPTRQESFILKQAVDFDIVQSDQNTGFIYRTIQLGLTEPEAVLYLRNHPNISTAIESLVLQKKEDTVKSNTVVKQPKSSDAELKAAQDKIAELEARLKKQSETNIEVASGQSLEGDAPDPELETLKARAKDLKIQGWHLANDKDKLREKIEKAELAKN